VPQPLFTVIIPTYQRASRLNACLDSLGRMAAPPEGFEVVVVDDGSPRAEETAAALKTTAPSLPLRFIIQRHSGPARARNRGAEEAAGRYLAFIDDDCRADHGWLIHLAGALNGAKGRLVGGRLVNALPGNLFAEATQALMSYLYSYYLKQGRSFFASCNLALSRDDFLAVGGFDVRFPLAGGEDREFCRRCRRQGLELVYDDDALVHHHHTLGPRSFLRQHFNYGRGASFYHRVRSADGGDGSGAEPLWFYLNLLASPFTAPECRRPWRVSCLLSVAQLATAAGFILERVRGWITRPGPPSV